MEPEQAPHAVLAEQALLGALLWDPRRLRDVTWLRAQDVAAHPHRAIYSTLTGLVRAARPIDLLELPTVLARGDYHDVHIDPAAGNGPLSAWALSELLSMTPASPPPTQGLPTSGRSEHRRYAEIVLEESIRRQVATMGTRIVQIGTQHRDALRPGDGIRDTSAAISRALEQATAQLEALSTQLIRSTTATPNPAITSDPALIAAEITALTSESLYNGGEHDEATLIGAAIGIEPLRAMATARLLPGDFTVPAAAATWAALREATEAGEPVDFVLLAARLHRTGPHPEHGPGFPPDRLAELSRHSDIAAGHHALAALTHAALLRATEHTQQLLTATAAGTHPSAEHVLGTARAVLHHLDATRRRLDDRPRTGPGGAPRTPAPSVPIAAKPNRPAIPARLPTPLPRLPAPRHRAPGRSR
jgi:replicative DNA helicase